MLLRVLPCLYKLYYKTINLSSMQKLITRPWMKLRNLLSKNCGKQFRTGNNISVVFQQYCRINFPSLEPKWNIYSNLYNDYCITNSSIKASVQRSISFYTIDLYESLGISVPLNVINYIVISVKLKFPLIKKISIILKLML